jgi:type VI secretion system secreted protein Hcp
MALMAYMYPKGQKSGQIKGSVTQKGREDSIQVMAYSHDIVSPRDPQSGLPTGQRLHKPLVITKEVDKSSPLLYNVLCTNENLTEVTIKFWAPVIKAASGVGVGSEKQNYTIKLTNANIAGVELSTQEFSHSESITAAKEIEKISFTYQKIEWTWTDGGITAQDDWEARV